MKSLQIGICLPKKMNQQDHHHYRGGIEFLGFSSREVKKVNGRTIHPSPNRPTRKRSQVLGTCLRVKRLT